MRSWGGEVWRSGGGVRITIPENHGRGPRQNAHNPIPLDRGVQFWRLDFRVPLYLVLVTSKNTLTITPATCKHGGGFDLHFLLKT